MKGPGGVRDEVGYKCVLHSKTREYRMKSRGDTSRRHNF